MHERILADRDGSWQGCPAKAARVEPLASTGHRRWPSVGATHRLRHGALREVDGTALSASRVRRLLAVALLGLALASRGRHGQRWARASRCVVGYHRSNSWAQRCGAIRRQPAALGLGSGFGGRRASASIHTP
jgi:hypothetical protein